MKVRLATLLVLLTGLALVISHTTSSRPHRTKALVRPSPLAPRSSILALGDSVPAAEVCGCPSFVSVLAQRRSVATHTIVTARNLAQDGLTSLGLLNQVSADSLHADPSTITVVTIGANDFDSQVLSTTGCRSLDQLSCYAGDLRTMTDNVEQVLDMLTAGRHGPVLVTGYWNVFLDGPVGAAQGSVYARDSDALTLRVNAALAQACAQSGAWYVDIYQPFKSAGEGEASLLAADGDHPSAKGHAVIAEALEASLVAHGS